ncbi:hypothetical protein EJB05_44817, partial [Eragrostis curvula]
MEVVASAVLSEIVGRIFTYVIDSFLRSRGRGRDAHRQRLERLLLDIGAKVEEAEGRHITNLSLLAQLQAVTDAMHRGRFALEVADLDDEEEATTGKRKLAALRSPLNAVKRARLVLGGSATTEKRLAVVVEELEALTREYMGSFVEMVKGYPRRNNVPRPLTTTLFMDRCVFGRHVETEHVVAFLLQPAPRSTGLSALVVVGDFGVGKTTLVKHACDDERVRGHFAHVNWFDLFDVKDAGRQPGQPLTSAGDATTYLTGMRRILDEPRFRAVGRSLLVFDDFNCCPINESACATLLATNKLAEGSKLIFTTKNADLARIIGTVEPVVLRPLPEEEYWYYFKALALGGADPQEHQRIAAVGREISRHLGSSFLDARLLGDLLRANFDARFWRRVLAAVVKRQGSRTPALFLDDLLSITGWTWSGLTVHDVARLAGISSSGSTLARGDTQEAFTIHCAQACRELDTDRSFYIVFKKEGWAERSFAEDAILNGSDPRNGSSESYPIT